MTVDAIYQDGVFKLLQPLPQVPDNHTVRITVTLVPPGEPLGDVIGILPDEDAREIDKVIRDEFGRVNPDDWK